MAIPEGVKVVDVIIQTDETARQTFFLDTFISHNLPLLLVGPTGTGKSAINNYFLVRLPKEKSAEDFFLLSVQRTVVYLDT